MAMALFGIHKNQIFEPLLVQEILGEHLADGLAQNRLRILREFLIEGQLLEVSYVARVVVIDLFRSRLLPVTAMSL